jgi:hypothetical protein
MDSIFRKKLLDRIDRIFRINFYFLVSGHRPVGLCPGGMKLKKYNPPYGGKKLQPLSVELSQAIAIKRI